MTSRRGHVLRGVLSLAAAVAMTAGGVPTTYAEDRGLVFRIRSGDVTESSSLVVSSTQERLAYTTNDSGDAAVVYAVDTGSGRVVGRTTLTGVDAYDVEALGGGSDGSLVVADIGDNSGVRERVTFARIEQPARGDHAVTPDVVSLRYVDGARDAESVLYDSESGRIFVVSKEFGDAHVYRSRADAFAHRFGVLRPIAAAPPLATDATYLPGGDYVVVRGYIDATVFRAAGWTRVERFSLPAQEQGESIAAPPSGDVVWVGTEGNNSPVVAVPIPSLPTEPGESGSGPGNGARGPETAPGGGQSAGADSQQPNADTDEAALD
ncbi:MAG: hypothetical protein ACRDO2_14100, partial [Nocardioidaceae bacterium]